MVAVLPTCSSCTEIPNIPSLAGSGKYTVNGVKYDWVFVDYLPVVATAQFPGLESADTGSRLTGRITLFLQTFYRWFITSGEFGEYRD